MDTPPDLILEHLRAQQLEEAWPLLQSASAASIPAWWRHEATELLNEGGGVLVARRPDGLVHGLATYQRLTQSPRDSVLTVTRLVTLELSLKEPVRQALLQALEVLARELNCSSMAVTLPM